MNGQLSVVNDFIANLPINPSVKGYGDPTPLFCVIEEDYIDVIKLFVMTIANTLLYLDAHMLWHSVQELSYRECSCLLRDK